MFKTKLILIPLLLIGFTLLFLTHEERVKTTPPTQTPSQEISEDATVLRIIDGDTVVVLIDGTEEHVRLLGVNASEIEYDDDVRTTKRECYALEARDELQRLTLGKNVLLESDPLNEDRDAYQRLLRYVILEGRNINEELIQNGFARHLSYFPITQNDTFSTSEETAQNENVGLWAMCD